MNSTDAELMKHEIFETAVCAASDLAARFARELAIAVCQMEHAERTFQAAAADASAFGAPIPFHVRRERMQARREVAMLRRVLGGMPTIHGGRHAASA